jgi:hypothetical protein
MCKILTDFSPATLMRANRANLYEFFTYFQNSPYMEFAMTMAYRVGVVPFNMPGSMPSFAHAMPLLPIGALSAY